MHPGPRFEAECHKRRWPSHNKNVSQIGKYVNRAKAVWTSRALGPTWVQKLTKTPHTSRLQAFFYFFVDARGIAMGN